MLAGSRCATEAGEVREESQTHHTEGNCFLDGMVLRDLVLMSDEVSGHLVALLSIHYLG